MFKDGWRTSVKGGNRQLALMDLRIINSIPYEEGDLEAAIALCPSVVHVEIETYWGQNTWTDEELKPLLNLKNLRHLCLEWADRVTFEGGLLPILRKFGPSTLDKLELKRLPEVDVSAIAKYCSNLRSRTLESIKRFIAPSRPLKPQDNRLQRLEHLDMTQSKQFQPYTTADMLILLSSPALVTLDLYRVGGLSDQVMEEATRLYRFPNLRELRISCCDGNTERSIDCFLSLDNPLQKIELCLKNDGRNDEILEKWESQIKTNNWDLSIEW